MGGSKILPLEKDHRIFLRDVEKLLYSVGVETTGNIHRNLSAGRHRKDGFTIACYRIFLRTTFFRILYFDELFKLRYAKDKKERLQKRIPIAKTFKDKKCLEYAKEEKERLEKEVKIAREHKELNSN